MILILKCNLLNCLRVSFVKAKMWCSYRNLRGHLKSTVAIYRGAKNSSQVASPRIQVDNGAPDIQLFKVGEKINGFEVKRVQEISEFRMTAILLSHEKTKTEYLHLFRNDNNNVFSVNFRTTPLNSTGLPHILEHTVLCGSQLYPVRDPFFKMLNRSLATFMNAMTGSDYTMYPFSTQNLSDYHNLQKIYLDAAFRPNLKEMDFMQEGWRLENTNPNDPKTDVIIKGVVYNEMKGAFSENDSILQQKLQNLILPDHTYGVISGGDPMEIPNLTWDDLKKFHEKHYHPSNSKLYSYGNFPLEPSLRYINDEYLSHFDYQSSSHTVVPQQVRWTEPKRQHLSWRFETMGDPIEKQNAASISLLLSDITNVYDTFLMQFVSELLIFGPNSPFYKSMIEPNFSGGYIPSTGYDVQPRDSIFTVGLQGIKQEDYDKVVDIFDQTLNNVVLKGFDAKHVESVLHRYELDIKHESASFGLKVLFNIVPTWNHNGDIISALQVNRLIERLKSELANNPKYLQDVVEKHFRSNYHRLILTASADKDFEKKQENLEKDLIAKKTRNLSDADKKAIFQKAQELQNEQNAKQDTDILPTLTMNDISTRIDTVPTEKVVMDAVPVQINKVNSNGIVYFKALLSTIDLSPEEQMLLPLLSYVLTKLGTDKLNYRDFDSMVNNKTAGLNVSPFIGESLFHLHSYEPSLVLSSHCLEKNLSSMFDLWLQIFNLSKLEDVERFKMLVQLYMANLTHGLADSGHAYAMTAAAGLVSGTSYQKELLSGLYHITYMKRLVKTSNYQAMLDEIVNIAKNTLKKSKMRCAINLTPDTQQNVVKSFKGFLCELKSNNPYQKPDHTYVEGKVWAPMDAVNCQHHVLNIPVHYCSKAILTVPYTDADYAKLRVLARLISAKYLHPELREKQGAYGGGARITDDGVFTFYSYRDPRHLQTLDVFDNSHKWLAEELDKLTDQEILEAKLGVFQAVDRPIPPSSKGNDEFLRRLTPDILKRHRAELMSVDKADLRSMGEKYLSTEDGALVGKVILGPKSTEFDTTSRDNELWTVMDSD